MMHIRSRSNSSNGSSRYGSSSVSSNGSSIKSKTRFSPRTKTTVWCLFGSAFGCLVMSLVLLITGTSKPPNTSRKMDSIPSISAQELMLPLTTPLRVFGPKPFHSFTRHENTDKISFRFFSREEMWAYLQHYGQECSSFSQDFYWNLPPVIQVEFWKYCFLYNGHGNVYLEPDNVVLLQEEELLLLEPSNVAISMSNGLVHGSLLKLDKNSKLVAYEMMRVIAKTPTYTLQRDLFLLQRTLHNVIETYSQDSWTRWQASCRDLQGVDSTSLQQGPLANVSLQTSTKPSVEQRMLQALSYKKQTTTQSSLLPPLEELPWTHGKPTTCPVKGGYCCKVVVNSLTNTPILLLKHPGPTKPNETTLAQAQNVPLDDPSHVNQQQEQSNDYMATVRQVHTGLQPAPELPSFFDLLLENDCLDATMTCHKCLKSTKAGSCNVCKEACPCFCNVLCQVRPPAKPITAVFQVTLPKYKREAHRFIPRMVHQTWYEPVTREKYPNMSRLIQSWKASGWEYHFYNDDESALFLEQHFPPQVRQAYDAILPGAFKADLFRYCVLFIKGGVYADMDVLLEANLDLAVSADVGFMTPIDEPGYKVGHRSCLWNGFLAVAPGHVFLAKTIEMVVNHVRNRFTSVDYDDMLCPSPALSVTHTVDTLFTCGPCILGAAVNAVLQRHLQEEFEIGDVDLFKSGRNKVHFDDPRLSIPGRTVILQQDKQDMGAHRFTWEEKSLIVAATDMPDYDDRPKDVEHYSKTHEKVGVYGLKKLYKDNHRANEEIQIVIVD